MKTPYVLNVVDNTAVWVGGDQASDLDLWFLPGFAESHLCFRGAFGQEVARRARILMFDPPGLGASPPRTAGLTVRDCARLWENLVRRLSGSRTVALVAHSMAGIVATLTAGLLASPPAIVVSVEGNLTRSDAFFTGRAADYESPDEFYRFFSQHVLKLAKAGRVPMSYYASLQFADATTLWTLGRSVLEFEAPGKDFERLKCPAVYYWDQRTTPADTQKFLAESGLRQRRLDGLGHWPMIAAPDRFYSMLKEDVFGRDR